MTTIIQPAVLEAKRQERGGPKPPTRADVLAVRVEEVPRWSFDERL